MSETNSLQHGRAVFDGNGYNPNAPAQGGSCEPTYPSTMNLGKHLPAYGKSDRPARTEQPSESRQGSSASSPHHMLTCNMTVACQHGILFVPPCLDCFGPTGYKPHLPYSPWTNASRVNCDVNPPWDHCQGINTTTYNLSYGHGTIQHATHAEASLAPNAAQGWQLPFNVASSMPANGEPYVFSQSQSQGNDSPENLVSSSQETGDENDNHNHNGNQDDPTGNGGQPPFPAMWSHTNNGFMTTLSVSAQGQSKNMPQLVWVYCSLDPRKSECPKSLANSLSAHIYSLPASKLGSQPNPIEGIQSPHYVMLFVHDAPKCVADPGKKPIRVHIQVTDDPVRYGPNGEACLELRRGAVEKLGLMMLLSGEGSAGTVVSGGDSPGMDSTDSKAVQLSQTACPFLVPTDGMGVGAVQNGPVLANNAIGPGTHVGSGTSADQATSGESNFSMEICSVSSDPTITDTVDNEAFGDNDLFSPSSGFEENSGPNLKF